MSKGYIYISNNTVQTLTSGATVNPGAAQHGFGCVCGQKTISLNNTNINLNAKGYYNVSIAANVSDSAEGNVTLSLYQDGNLVASNSESIAAADDPASIAFPAGILVNNCSSVLTLVVTTSAGNPIINSINITIEKK